jgi:hypothetical protein
MVFSGPQKSLIRRKSITEVIPFIPPYCMPPVCPESPKSSYMPIKKTKDQLPTAILMLHFF